jgi:hypothetical protein
MIKRALVGGVLAACLAAPAAALEHEVVIDHSAGSIAADYRGAVRIETKQVGTAGAPGRASTLRCQWRAALDVERVAKVGASLSSRRTLTSEDVASGYRPGWCPTDDQALAKLVEPRGPRMRAALMALVAQDRAVLVAEADTATTRG